MTEAEQREIARRLEYNVLASELATRNAARRKQVGKPIVLWGCVCGWQGPARAARAHRCDQKKISKL